MTQLIKKELILEKKLFWFSFLYSIFLFFVFANPVIKECTYSMTAFGISYVAILGIAQAEYKNNSDIVMNSLPVTRPEIVKAKYLSVLTCAVFALIIAGAVGLGFHQLPGTFHYRLINRFDILTTIVSVAVIAAVSLPVYFKTGAQWARMINMAVFMLIFFAPAQVVEYLAKNNQQPWLINLTVTISDNIWLITLGGLGVIAALLLVSYLISLGIYLHRDF